MRIIRLTKILFFRLLNGTVLQSFVRPSVLITDAFNALNTQPSRRKKDQEFIGAILFLIINSTFHLSLLFMEWLFYCLFVI